MKWPRCGHRDRAGRAGRIQLAESDVDMAILRDGDLVDCGKVRLKIRVK